MRPRLASNVSLGQEPMCARHYEGCAPQQNECTCRRWPYSSPRRRQALQYRGSVFRDAKHLCVRTGFGLGFGLAAGHHIAILGHLPVPTGAVLHNANRGTELSCTGLGGCPGPGSGEMAGRGSSGKLYASLYIHPRG